MATGVSARASATRFGAPLATTDAEAALTLPDADAVLIATRHDTHSDYATQLTNRIITPLRLHNTFYLPDVSPPAVASRMVAGYYFNHDTASAGLAPLLGRDVRPFSISWTRAAGGMVRRR